MRVKVLSDATKRIRAELLGVVEDCSSTYIQMEERYSWADRSTDYANLVFKS